MVRKRSLLGGRGNYQVVGALSERVLKRMIGFIEEEGWSKVGKVTVIVPEGMHYQTLVRPKYIANPKLVCNRPITRLHYKSGEDLTKMVERYLSKGWKVTGGAYKTYYGELAQELIKE